MRFVELFLFLTGTGSYSYLFKKFEFVVVIFIPPPKKKNCLATSVVGPFLTSWLIDWLVGWYRMVGWLIGGCLQVLMREEFSDLYLVVGGNLIAVHQLVLSAHSTHLASLLATHTQAGGGAALLPVKAECIADPAFLLKKMNRKPFLMPSLFRNFLA